MILNRHLNKVLPKSKLQHLNFTFIKFLFLINPFVDMLIYFTRKNEITLPINQFFRFFIYSVMIILLFFNSREQLKKWLGINTLVLASSLIAVMFSYSTSFRLDLVYSFRVSYGLTVYYYLRSVTYENLVSKEYVFKYLIIGSLIVALNVITSIFGLGQRSWSTGRFGYKGYFDGQNVISQVLIISIFCTIFIKNNIKNLTFLILISIQSIGLLLIGTRSGQMGLILVVLSILMKYLIFLKSSKKNTRIIVAFLLLFIVFITPFVLIKSANYLMSIGNYDSIWSLLLSHRNHMAKLVTDHYSNYDMSYKILFIFFGMGYSNIRTLLTSFKLTPTLELDYIASFFYSGLLVTIYIVVLNLGALKKLYHNIFVEFKIERWYMFCLLIVSNILAFINGHVFFETLVAPYIYGVLAICLGRKTRFNDEKKN